MASEWLILTTNNSSFDKIFIKKADVEYVSTVTANGSTQTCVTGKVRGRKRVFSVVESAKEIMYKL